MVRAGSLENNVKDAFAGIVGYAILSDLTVDAVTEGPDLHEVVLQETSGRTSRVRVFDVLDGEIYASTTFLGSRFHIFATHRFVKEEGLLRFAETIISKSMCRDYASKITQIPASYYHDDNYAQPQMPP